jgi:hypothetical protein
MFLFNPNFYYLSIVLQAICVYHCARHGNQNKWIWIIVFVPYIGCLIYFFSEIVTGREIGRVQSGLGGFINPSGSICKLESNLRFSDTFANRIALADAYLASGDTDKAISIYEESLNGTFEEKEYVLSQLVAAYHRRRLYERAVWASRKNQTPSTIQLLTLPRVVCRFTCVDRQYHGGRSRIQSHEWEIQPL